MIHLADICDHMCKVTGVPRATLLGASRHRSVVRLRQAAAFVARRKLGMTYEAIGHVLGRHHSTVLDSAAAIENLMRRRDRDALRAYRIAIRAKVLVSRRTVELLPLQISPPLQDRIAA